MATEFEPGPSGAERRNSNAQSRKATASTTTERRNEKRQEITREYVSVRAKMRSPLKTTSESQVNGKRSKEDERSSAGKKLNEEVQRRFRF